MTKPYETTHAECLRGDWLVHLKNCPKCGVLGCQTCVAMYRKEIVHLRETQGIREARQDQPGSPEQQAREMLDRLEVDGALDMSTGDVVEVANLIAFKAYAIKMLELLRGEHEKARYEGDGDPGCNGNCRRCLIDQVLKEA